MFERLNEKSWCKAHSLELTSVRPFHVAAWIEDFHGKLAMTARLRRWPDRELSTNRQVTPLKAGFQGVAKTARFRSNRRQLLFLGRRCCELCRLFLVNGNRISQQRFHARRPRPI